MSIQLSEAAPADRRAWIRRGLVLLGLAVGVVLAGVLLSGPAHADDGHGLLPGSTAQPGSTPQRPEALDAVAQQTRRTTDKLTQRAEAVVRTTTRVAGQAARPAVHPAPAASESTAPDRSRPVTQVARDDQAPSAGRQEPRTTRTTHAPRRSAPAHAAGASPSRIDVASTVRETTTHATHALVTLTDRTTESLRAVTDAVAPALSPVVHAVGTTVDATTRHLDTTVQRTTRVLGTGTGRLEDRPTTAEQAPRASIASTVREPHTSEHHAIRGALGSQHRALRPAATSVPTTPAVGASSEGGPAKTLDSAPLPRPAQPSHGDPIGACGTSSGSSSSFHGAAPAALLSGTTLHDVRTVSTHPGYDRALLSGPSFDPGSSPD